MDFYAVLILECMLFVHASCQPIGKETEGVMSTINLTLEDVGTMLSVLTVPGLLPNKSCNISNIMELLGPEQQPLAAHHFSTFHCYMELFSNHTKELTPELLITAEFMKNVEEKLSGAVTSKNCSLPAYKERADHYFEAKCFLEITRKRLQNFKL